MHLQKLTTNLLNFFPQELTGMPFIKHERFSKTSSHMDDHAPGCTMLYSLDFLL